MSVFLSVYMIVTNIDGLYIIEIYEWIYLKKNMKKIFIWIPGVDMYKINLSIYVSIWILYI